MSHATPTRPRPAHAPAPASAPALPRAASLRHVLFASDLSPASAAAFAHARLLAERTGARLTLLHVLEAERVGRPLDPGPIHDELYRRADLLARESLSRLCAEVRCPADVAVAAGESALRVVAAEAEGLEADVLVMATRGRGPVTHLLLGSVTEQMLRHLPCPVLCVRPNDHPAPDRYRRLLLPTDLSERSRRVLPMAARLAHALGAQVVACHVTALPPMETLVGWPYIVEDVIPTEEDVRMFLEPELRGLDLVVSFEHGPAGTGIVAAARASHADLILATTHGHDSLTDRVFGTGAEWLVRHAPCPVLVM